MYFLYSLLHFLLKKSRDHGNSVFAEFAKGDRSRDRNRQSERYIQDMSKENTGIKIVSDNRKARYLYEILETYEAGIQLLGTEVKSIRDGRANLRDGYGLLRDGEAWLLNVHISPHQSTTQAFNHDPRRTRKLLLHRQELRKLIGKVEQKGLTLVPLKLYLQRGWIKVTLALAKGKKLHDKRETLKKRQTQREVERVLKQY